MILVALVALIVIVAKLAPVARELAPPPPVREGNPYRQELEWRRSQGL